MDDSVEAVEKILKYSFTNKSLLEEALTHTSSTCFKSSFERLEFLGDSVLGLAFTNYIHLANPNLDLQILRDLHAINVSNEKFARVAVKHGLYKFFKRDSLSPGLDYKIKKFSKAVDKEEDPVLYGGFVKAPKFLADMVESIAGAVYIDMNFDLQRLWEIFKGLMEPIYTLSDLQQEPLPILTLVRLADKLGKRIKFEYWKEVDSNKFIAKVYLDDEFISSGDSKLRDLAKLAAANEALLKLSKKHIPIDSVIDEDSSHVVQPETPKEKLYEIFTTGKRKLQTGSSSLAIASEKLLIDEITPAKIGSDEDSPHDQPEDAKGKLFEICSTEKLEKQTGSSSLAIVSEKPLTDEITPTKMVNDEDQPEDTKGKLFEICSTEKLEKQIGSSSLAATSEKPLTDEITTTQMVINEDSPHVEPEDVKGKLIEICSTRKLQIHTGSSSASENPLTYEMTQQQMVVEEDSLEVEPEEAKSELIRICTKKKWNKPIFSVEENIKSKPEKRFVCSVKIEIPTIEGTFHIKGDEKSKKKQAENSSAYHMIKALKSSLMTFVIKNLEMQKSLKDNKNLHHPEENKRKRRKII